MATPRSAPDESDVREYLQRRRELQGIFPGLFLSIRERVERNLADLGARGVVGELDREAALARDPGAALSTPYDWVAFGFRGFEFYDAHVGVVMDTRSWPCTCHVGFHRREHLPAQTHENVERVDWAAAVGAAPEDSIVEHTREHQLRDAPRAFDFADLEREIEHYATRAVAYYRTAATALLPPAGPAVDTR